jgi:hypothetical protein
LYDLSADRGERNDLSAQKPEETKRLLRKIEAWDKLAAPLLFFDPSQGPADGPHPHAGVDAQAPDRYAAPD